MSECKYGSMMNKHISKTKLIIKRKRRRGKGCIASVNCAPLSHCAIGGATICSIKPIGCNQEEEQGAGGGPSAVGKERAINYVSPVPI